MVCEYCKKEGHGIESCPQLEIDSDRVVAMVEDEPDQLSFSATIDLPIIFEVEERDIEKAEAVADKRFAAIYDLIEEAVRGWRAGGVWPEGSSLGNRYDDTDIEEVTT